jgi:hypothetical protein
MAEKRLKVKWCAWGEIKYCFGAAGDNIIINYMDNFMVHPFILSQAHLLDLRISYVTSKIISSTN